MWWLPVLGREYSNIEKLTLLLAATHKQLQVALWQQDSRYTTVELCKSDG